MLEGALTLSGMTDRGIFATRQLAKRQLTWLRGLREAGRIDLALDFADSATPAKIWDKIKTNNRRFSFA